MKLLLFASGITLSVFGQTPSLKVKFTPGPNGSAFLTLHNSTTSKVTAYAYTCTEPGGGSVGIVDAAFSDREQPITPGETGTPAAVSSNMQCTFEAALSADGSSFGDPAWALKLAQRRSLAQDHVNLAIAIVEDALRNGGSVASVVAKAQQGMASAQAQSQDPSVLAPSQSFYREIITNLTGKPNQSGGAADSDRTALQRELTLLNHHKARLDLY